MSRKLRMPEINHVTVAGRLTRDPETRYTGSGRAVCGFGLAMDRVYKGEKQTLFLDVTAWGKTAEFVGENLAKGRAVHVEGRLECEEWTTREGVARKKIKVVAMRIQSLDWADDREEPEGQRSLPTGPTAAVEDEPVAEDDLPF